MPTALTMRTVHCDASWTGGSGASAKTLSAGVSPTA